METETHLSYESGSDVWRCWTNNRHHKLFLDSLGYECIEGSYNIPTEHLKSFKMMFKSKYRGTESKPMSEEAKTRLTQSNVINP